jgi:hypothetical protein
MRSRCAAMVLAGVVILATTAQCQMSVAGELSKGGTIKLTGNARMDLLAGLGMLRMSDSSTSRISENLPGEKSPLLAGAMSLLIPGSGEYYTKSYWRAGGFVIAEAALWVFYATYYSKGNNQTDLFQNFADDHWSVVRYAQWIQDNLAKLNPDVPSFTGYLIPGTENRPPWERVDWAKINAVETAIAQTTGNGFTHQLPHRPEQQYFELIGKYPQFAAGWDDAGVMTVERILNSDVSARFLDYSKMRGKANDFYNIATTGSVLIVVNHLLSALDAAWSASQFNHRLRIEAHLQPTVRSSDFVEFVPTARVTITF